ncbi:MAG TPA: AMP-binding protein [Dehalococcoidia bacterium]|nr:AMP-binding protein [Dehalococcoidia bacterium]
MSSQSGLRNTGLARQREIQAGCFHPAGAFIEFQEEDAQGSIPDRFQQQVRRYPRRLAFKSSTQAFNYDQLNQAANRLAWAILGQWGPGQEPVGLLVEQDAAMVVGMLGVWKAGKTYVALDPTFPQSRNRYMLEDSQAALVVTNHRNLGLAKELAPGGCRVLDFDQLAPNLSSPGLAGMPPAQGTASTSNPDLALPSDGMADILYTSGSTGQPKGVIQSHHCLLWDVRKRTNNLHICPQDRLTLLAAGTTASVSAILLALLNGAALHSLDVKEEGAAGLAHWLVQEEITVLLSSPPLFRHFADSLTGEEQFPNLRLVQLRSDTVYPKDVERYNQHFPPSCILVNSLSSTEAGGMAQYFIDHHTEVSGEDVPVGYPPQGTELLLLDDEGRQVGADQVGEIAIKSPSLSPGYWRRPELTQERFRPDPMGGNQRIYLTGDLGLRRPDGCLVHRGRKDFQVKIRGYRVELAEVELALHSVGNVKEAAVVAREEPDGNQALVAYVAPNQQPPPSVGELRGFMKAKFPDYMVPSAFVFLDSLPVTANGKVDRKALPPPGNQRPSLDQDFAAPSTSMEEMLAQIWTEVLGVERVSVHDNFFELGGHSLLGMKVIARLKKATGLRINPKELGYQSLGQLASTCEERLGDHPLRRPGASARGLLDVIKGAVGIKRTSIL